MVPLTPKPLIAPINGRSSPPRPLPLSIPAAFIPTSATPATAGLLQKMPITQTARVRWTASPLMIKILWAGVQRPATPGGGSSGPTTTPANMSGRALTTSVSRRPGTTPAAVRPAPLGPRVPSSALLTPTASPRTATISTAPCGTTIPTPSTSCPPGTRAI